MTRESSGSSTGSDGARFAPVAAKAMGSATFFTIAAVVGHFLFRRNPAALVGLLFLGHWTGWHMGSRLYPLMSPSAWLRALTMVRYLLIVIVLVAAAELYREYSANHDLVMLSLASLCVAGAATMLQLTVRSYAVSLLCLLSSAANLLLYIRTAAWPILVVILICFALAFLALLSRPADWTSSRTTK